ncbi:MAG: DNA primase [Gemmatimonadetes bacterium]|nr:DNA primase [Gemmatimonadota bacterium]
MAKYPEDVISEIRDRLNLVELIGGYVNLKRSGRNHQGLCPFHQEKTPSFNVNEDRQIYHCFGCQVTGDCYKFLMEHDHLSFPEAVRTLAEQVGVDLSPYEGPGASRSAEDFDELYRAHKIAAMIYRTALKTDEGKAARAELARRGLKEEVLERYGVGASPDAWDRVLNAAKRDGIRPSSVERAGLAIRRDSGTGYYDRFRGRLMFPIETLGNKVVGFGGRILEDGEPKYLNSPETPIFQKRRMLYGFPQARDGLRALREAILVEGYTDVLALSQAGFTNVLASLGTAFTEDHAKFLARTTERVVVVFDGDDAGMKAAQTSIAPLLSAGLAVRVVLLPGGQDPDSLVREGGAEAFSRAVEAARPALDVVLGEEIYEEGVAREHAVRRGLETLSGVTDPLRRRVYLEDMAARCGTPPEVLEQQVRALRKSQAAAAQRRTERDSLRGPAPAGGSGGSSGSTSRSPEPAAIVRAAVPETARPSVLERTVVAVMVHDGARGAHLARKFGPERFDHPVVARIVAKAADLARTGSLKPNDLMAAFQEDAVAYGMMGELTTSREYAIGIAQQAEDCEVLMERRALEREMKDVMREMKKANARGDAGEVHDYVRRKAELAKGIAALRAPKNPYET